MTSKKFYLPIALATFVVAFFCLVNSARAFEPFDERSHFTSFLDFKKFLVDKEVAPSLERLSITDDQVLDSQVRIVTALDTDVGIMNSGWPVFVLWQRKQDITAKQIAWTPSSSGVAHGDLVFKGAERVLKNYKDGKVYAILALNSLQEIVDEQTSEIRCTSAISMYLVMLDEKYNLVKNLTKNSVPLGNEKPCSEKQVNDISYSSSGDKLTISGSKLEVSPEQKTWIGNYIIKTGSLFRVDDLYVIKQLMIEADSQAIANFKKSQNEKAVSILSPLIEFSPVEALDQITVGTYNDYAFFLASSGDNERALPILNLVLEKYPNRAVAHLNIADVYFELGDKKKALIHYKLYMQLMKSNNNHTRIPKRVVERIEANP